MNVYHYIAENNPDAAYDLCKKYGYFQINSLDELGNTLQHIVANDGEKSLKEVMALHPDKDILIEIFDKKKAEETPVVVTPAPMANADGCGCNTKSGADGTTTPTSTVNKTDLYILGGAIIVSMAIFSLIKSKN
jgi:hypothetical protein